MAQAMKELGPVSEAVVVDSTRVTPEGRDEVRRIRLRVDEPAFRFSPGQSIGVVVPGPHAFGNRYHIRRYSIASGHRDGTQDAVEFELLVRRCFYVDEISGEQYPGIASNYLCDARGGAQITITGPFRSPFRIPQDDTANLVMIGTGTGVAPFRSFIQEIYRTNRAWHGLVRLYYGAKSGMDLLYRNDELDDLSNYYDRNSFKAFRAIISKPMASEGETLQAAIEGHAQDVWELMQDAKTHIYIAGLGKVVEAFDAVMEKAATSPTAWRQTREWLHAEGRWSELVYT